MKPTIVWLLAALTPVLASAEDVCPGTVQNPTAEICDVNESQESCQDRINALKVQNPAQDAADQADIQEKTAEAERAKQELPSLLALANSGDSVNSSINDFAPLIRLLLDSEGLGDDGQKIGFELSDPFGFGEKFQNKISVSLQKPEIFAPIKDALQAASLTDELSSLEDTVDARDDISISLGFGYVSKHFGRDPRLQQDWLERVLSSADARDPEPTAALNQLQNLKRTTASRSMKPSRFASDPSTCRQKTCGS